MTGHIAFAGFVLTAEEWEELAPELVDAVSGPIVVAPPTIVALGSGPVVELGELDDGDADGEPGDAAPVAITLTVTGSVLVGA